MKIFNEVMKDALKEKITLEVISIAKNWGITNISFEFDSLKSFFLIVGYDKLQSQGVHPDFTKDLKTNGFDTTMHFAHKEKGEMFYILVKKQV